MIAIAGNMKRFISRVQAAKVTAFKMFGIVPEGTGSYRRLCPKGAGVRTKGHTFAEQSSVGSRKAHRRSVRFIKALNQTAWGRALANN